MLLTQAVTCPSAWGAVLQGCRVSRCDLFVERCKAQASGAGTLLPPLALRPAAAPGVPLRRSVEREGPASCAGPLGQGRAPALGSGLSRSLRVSLCPEPLVASRSVFPTPRDNHPREPGTLGQASGSQGPGKCSPLFFL